MGLPRPLSIAWSLAPKDCLYLTLNRTLRSVVSVFPLYAITHCALVPLLELRTFLVLVVGVTLASPATNDACVQTFCLSFGVAVEATPSRTGQSKAQGRSHGWKQSSQEYVRWFWRCHWRSRGTHSLANQQMHTEVTGLVSELLNQWNRHTLMAGCGEWSYTWCVQAADRGYLLQRDPDTAFRALCLQMNNAFAIRKPWLGSLTSWLL